MALTRSFPIDEGYPNALDLRRLDAGLIVREGVFPDPTTTAAAGVAYGDGGWNVGAVAFVAALKRGGAPYSLSYGVARLANDAAGTAWTIDAAPASGSRIDLLWIRATDPGEGEATSGTDGPGGVARAVPVFGYTAGVAATSPVAPALPAGALLIATVTTPSGAASIAGSTIVQSYRFAQVAGGILYARTLSEFSAEAGLVGEEAITLTSYQRYRYDGSAWQIAPYVLKNTLRYYSGTANFVKADYPRMRALRVFCQGGGGGGGGTPIVSAGNHASAGGGGGGGAGKDFLTDIAGLAASVVVTVGAGGAGSAGAAGGVGGYSSFGALVIGYGGAGGEVGVNSALTVVGRGGAGGTSFAAQETAIGTAGGLGGGNATLGAGGPGGASLYGGGGRGSFSGGDAAVNNGEAGGGYGGGGGGASANSGAATTGTGGAGAPGIVIIEIFE